MSEVKLSDTTPPLCIEENQEIIESSKAAMEIKEDTETAITDEKVPGYVYTGKDLINQAVAELPTLLNPILPKIGLGLICGSSDTGKSAFLRQLATEISLGKETFLGFDLCLTHKSAIYVSTEDDEHTVAFLLQKQNADGIDGVEFINLRYVFDEDNLVKKLELELKRKPADLVVIDTLGDMISSDQNSSANVRAFFKPYRKIAMEHECLIMFNHHVSKSKENNVPSKTAVLGSAGIEGKSRILLELRKDKHEIDQRHLVILKGNYVPEEMKQRSMVLRFDQNMRFTNTGKAVPIEQLGGARNYNDTEEMKERAQELSKDGMRQRDIIAKLLEEFEIKVPKSTLSDWLAKMKEEKSKTEKDNDSDGPSDTESITV